MSIAALIVPWVEIYGVAAGIFVEPLRTYDAITANLTEWIEDFVTAAAFTGIDVANVILSTALLSSPERIQVTLTADFCQWEVGLGTTACSSFEFRVKDVVTADFKEWKVSLGTTALSAFCLPVKDVFAANFHNGTVPFTVARGSIRN